MNHFVINSLRRVIVGTLAACLAFAVFAQESAPAIDLPGLVAPVRHTEAEIRARLSEYEKLTAGPAYAEQPSFKAPYRVGKLAGPFVAQALATLNLGRYLAGLDDHTVVDPGWAMTAQFGAVLLRIINKGLNHTPPMPNGIGLTKDFYDRGYAGTSSSNLDQGAASAGEAVRHFLDDSDDSNIDRLGHRRWVLSPGLSRTGFGYAEGYASLKVFSTDSASSTSSSRKTPSPAWVTWPAAGAMPLAWFGPKQAWSLSLDPVAFGGSIKMTDQGIRVSIKRQRDGRQWQLGENSHAGYFAVETSGFGLPFCVIFRPDGLDSIHDSDQFEVKVQGLQAADGSSIPVLWTTGFFSTGPAITTQAVSRHPSKLTLTGLWQSAGQSREKTELAGAQATFGYVGVPLTGFSWLLDSPDGVVPIGFRINGSDRIFGPGEWVDAAEGISRFTVVSSEVKLIYAIYTQKKGWSSWFAAGAEASFGTGMAIETISIILQ